MKDYSNIILSFFGFTIIDEIMYFSSLYLVEYCLKWSQNRLGF